tara:strand:- start:402 stop:923 length:522 start_codon:yes stop_codon:yes gene_type:complete
MKTLTRVTSEFIEAEDRYKITGVCEDGETLIFWLTQRLLIRLINHCFVFLDSKSDEIAQNSNINDQPKSNLQGFAQQPAEKELPVEDPVIAKHNSRSYLIEEIDLQFGDNGLLLVFKEGMTKQAGLALNIQQLRQWLAIIHNVWQIAEWPMSIWPDWISTSDQTITSNGMSIH